MFNIINREMQIKATMTYYYTSNRIARNKNKRKERLAVQIAGKDSKQLKHSYMADDMENDIVTVEKSLVVSHNVKHTLTIYPSSCTLRYVK